MPCDPRLTALVGAVIAAEGYPVLPLPSGAGHDGMAAAAIAPIAMVFVRCRGGISHNPAEFASLPDIKAGARVLLGFLAGRVGLRMHGPVHPISGRPSLPVRQRNRRGNQDF